MTQQALNRELLRLAGEHLGTLAEREHEAYCMDVPHRAVSNRIYQRYARLLRLSREVLEIANAD